MAYRAYLAELEREGRQTLSILAGSMLFFALIHPLLLLLAVPAISLSWFALYRSSKRQFARVLIHHQVLRRALRFDDYDPDLAESIEPGVHEGVLRLKHSKLENFWRSYESSCRMLGHTALEGYRHVVWMILPLVVLTLGLIAANPLREQWNWMPEIAGMPADYWMAILQVLAWLLGIGAATLGKYVIQVALVSAAWTAVVSMPAEAAEEASEMAALPRDEIITWRVPKDGKPLAATNGSGNLADED